MRSPHPLIEVHLHLEGCLRPSRARALWARRPHLPPPPQGPPQGEVWTFQGLHGFLKTFGWAGRLLDGPAAYGDLLEDAADLLEAEGVLHAELFLAAGMMRRFGVEIAPVMEELARRAEAREKAGGVSLFFLLDAVRQWGPAEAEAVLDAALELREARVVGVGIGGDETALPAADFRSFYRRARRAGLGTSLHAGEGTTPSQVAEALDLGVDRIGHGIAATGDARVLARLARSGAVVEVCPTSNRVTGAWDPRRGPHPVLALLDAGVEVVLGSDDPAFFGTTPRGERDLLARWGVPAAERVALERRAAAAAFLPPDRRAALVARLDALC